jgi:hypothetical protein
LIVTKPEAKLINEMLTYYQDQRGLSKALQLPFQTGKKKVIASLEKKGYVKPVTVTMTGFPPCIVRGWEPTETAK